MPVSISGTNGVTFPDSSLQAAAASPYVLKNRIINGDMRIDQRSSGSSFSPTTTIFYGSCDRWASFVSQNSKLTIQQVADAPTGFTSSLKATSSSAYSIGASDYFDVVQRIEGFNTADLAFGTANAKTVTISFWVKSSLTGNFGANICNSAENRFYPFSYTISAANTWEQKTVTIAGDTTGTWIGATNGTGLQIIFSLGFGSSYTGGGSAWTASTYYQPTGSTNLVATNAATWLVTGVQLEQNTSATPFERRLYGQELANCQRYYEQFAQIFLNMSNGGFTNSYSAAFNFLVEKRATPTVTTFSGANISGTSGNVTLYPGAVNSSASYDILTTKNYNITKGGTSTYNLVSFSAIISSEL
jgi:hypothetical protein